MAGRTETIRLLAAAVLGAGAVYLIDRCVSSPSTTTSSSSSRSDEARVFSPSTDGSSLAALRRLVSRTTDPTRYPSATSIAKNIPIYDRTGLDMDDLGSREALMSEFHHILLHGPGVFVVKALYPDPSVLDGTNAAYAAILSSPRNASPYNNRDNASGEKPRSWIWNAFSKHCLTDPASFLAYYSNPLLALACEAYLGPGYRITSQLNTVHPGGAAQTCHRDYHLGFQSDAELARFPAAVQVATQLLTLQAAIAHTDMPLESGPTKLLPFSQLVADGYLRYREREVRDFFEQNYVALPLQKGDGLFFNPAIYHAAGENRTKDHDRSATLLQISAAFGKPMEHIDTAPLVEKTWDLLCEKFGREGRSAEVESFVNAVAEGYPFPTNLEKRLPAPGGIAPETGPALLFRALGEGWDTARVVLELKKTQQDSRAESW